MPFGSQKICFSGLQDDVVLACLNISTSQLGIPRGLNCVYVFWVLLGCIYIYIYMLAPPPKPTFLSGHMHWKKQV